MCGSNVNQISVKLVALLRRPISCAIIIMNTKNQDYWSNFIIINTYIYFQYNDGAVAVIDAEGAVSFDILVCNPDRK